MASKYPRLPIILIIGALMFSACDLLGTTAIGPTQVPADVIYTAAAQTLAAQLTQNAPPVIPPTSLPATEQPIVEPPTLVPSPTDTPILFTATLIPTFTPQFTATSTYPTIVANIDTNCRKGPGPQYQRIGALVVGQVAEVHGRNSAGTWWFVRLPTDVYCWVWGESTQVSGTTSSLPVLTPPPSPPTATATGTAFTASFASIKKCGGEKHAFFAVKNTGGKVLDSMSIKSRDMASDTVVGGPISSDSPFVTGTGDCPPGEDYLEPGDKAWVAGPIGTPSSGDEIKTAITLCTKEGLAGNCETI
ncbi:MAG: SH3 domain-containing protein, partial [Anaerolineales bacterium]|nr:SH3 domain-containing protein [Anaerolineales bacterium]